MNTLTLPPTAMIDQATAGPTATTTAIPTIAPTARRALRPTSTPIKPALTPSMPPPRILSFSVEPREVNPGEAVTVRWSTAGGSATIKQTGPDDYPYYDTEFIELSGEHTQAIQDRERLWHAFQLSVYRDALSSTQTITISIRCPYTYFFSPLPIEDREDWSCPAGAPSSSTAAEQVFENGRMIWLQHDGMIYVLWNDGTYRMYGDTWVAGQPDTDPSLIPPVGRTVPVRGFGKVWSGEAEVRARLGWALASEQGFETQLQTGWLRCCSRLYTIYRPFYLRNSEGRIIRLWPGEVPPGQWRFVTS